MKDFVSGIDLYDNKVNELENERENILSSSYSIIDKKANEKIQLQKKLNEISHQLNQQIEQDETFGDITITSNVAAE